MKTATQITEEFYAQREKQLKARRERVAAFMVSLGALDDQAILGDLKAIEQRAKIRRLLAEGEADLLGIACDHCGTELCNPAPDIVLDSLPQQRCAACAGCGWWGSIVDG